jgi:hypothetical protein
MYVFLDTLIKTSSQNDPRKIAIPDEAFLNNATYKQSIDVYKDRFSNAETSFSPLLVILTKKKCFH